VIFLVYFVITSDILLLLIEFQNDLKFKTEVRFVFCFCLTSLTKHRNRSHDIRH